MKTGRRKHLRSTYELLNSLIERGEAEKLAPLLGLKSAAAVRQFCRKPGNTREASGRISPLDKVVRIIDFFISVDNGTKRAKKIADHISMHAYGMHLEAPSIDNGMPEKSLVQEISKTFSVVGKMIEEINHSWFLDSPGEFTREEAIACTSKCHDALKQVAKLKCLVAMSTHTHEDL